MAGAPDRQVLNGRGVVCRVLSLALLVACSTLSLPKSADAALGFAEVVWKLPGARLPALAWKPLRPSRVVASHDGSLIFVAGEGGLRALEAATGALRWQAKTSDPVTGTPLVDGKVVTIADVGGLLQSFGVRNGVASYDAPLRLNAAVRAALSGDTDRIYAVTEPGNLLAVDRHSGKVLWRRAANAGHDFLAEGTSSAVVVGDQVIAGLADGSLVVVHGRDGGLVWQRELAGAGDGQPDVDTTPVVIGHGPAALVLAASQRGGLHALELATGEQRWHLPGEGFDTPLVVDAYAYALRGDHHLAQLRWADGKLLRSQRIAGEPSGDIGICQAGLLVPAGDGLWLIDATTLQARSRIVDPFGFAAAPLVAGEAAWLAANDGSVYALRFHAP